MCSPARKGRERCPSNSKEKGPSVGRAQWVDRQINLKSCAPVSEDISVRLPRLRTLTLYGPWYFTPIRE